MKLLACSRAGIGTLTCDTPFAGCAAEMRMPVEFFQRIYNQLLANPHSFSSQSCFDPFSANITVTSG